MKPKSSPTDNRSAVGEVYELYALEKKFQSIKAEYETRKKSLSAKIKSYMFANGFYNFKVHDKVVGSDIVITRVDPKRITWDADKLEKKLGKEECESFITRTYEIKDLERLVRYLKKCGVNPKIFKQYITVRRTLDPKAFNEWSDLNDIDEKDIADCYEVKDLEGYLRLSGGASEGK